MSHGTKEEKSEGKRKRARTRTDTESHNGTGSLRWRHPSFLSPHWSPTPNTIQSHIIWQVWSVLWWTASCVVFCVVYSEIYSKLRCPWQLVFRKTELNTLAPNVDSRCAKTSEGNAFDFNASDDDKSISRSCTFYPSWCFLLVKAHRQ